MDCWFCSVRPSETNHVLAIEMYGEVDALKKEMQTAVAYKVFHIEVPRCYDCHSRHNSARFAGIFFVLFSISFIFSLFFAAFGFVDQWIWGLWMGFSLGLMIGSLAIRFLVLKNIHSIRQAKISFPEIKELKDKCYRFGYRPRGQVTESDKPCDQIEEKQPR